MEASEKMNKYFDEMDVVIKKEYSIAQNARKKGYDPEEEVNIPLTKNMVERVEGLISAVAPQLIGSGCTKRMFELEKEFGVLDDPNFTFQVIYGIGEPHRRVLCAKKMPVLVYTGVAPDGNLEAGMSFIVRRLVENTSNQGILSELISN